MKADLCDPQQWIEAPVLHDQASILERIPQRYELALLHGVFFHDVSKHKAIGFHDAKATDFWVRGHIPGRPLMPGVVMIEIAAQLCSWLGTFADEFSGHFMGFAALDHARFRGQVVPGDRVIVAAENQRLRRNLATFAAQAWVGGEPVFEGLITGVRV